MAKGTAAVSPRRLPGRGARTLAARLYVDRWQAAEKYWSMLPLPLPLRSLSKVEEREILGAGAGAGAVPCVPRFPSTHLPVVPPLEGDFGDRVLPADEGVGACRRRVVYGSGFFIVCQYCERGWTGG